MGDSVNKREHGSIAAICGFLGVHLLLTVFAGAIPWQKPLFFFFFLSLVFLPGHIAASILFPRAKFYYKLLLSLLFGIVPFFILLTLFYIFRLNILYISFILPALTLVFALYREKGSFSGFDLTHNTALSRHIIVIMLLLIIAISVLTLGTEDPIRYTSDSQDHIAYIRAITRSHQVFPDQFIYKDGGSLTRDIRRGLMHSTWGTINLLTGRAEVHTIWPLISWIGVVFILLAIFCLGMQLFNNQNIAILGVVLYLLFFQRGFAGFHLTTAAYGFDFGKIYLFSFMIFSLSFVKTSKNIFLISAAAASFGAIGTHVSYLLIIPFFVLLMIVAKLSDSNTKDRKCLLLRTVPLLAATVAAVNLPYLVIRYFRDFQPANEIHTHVHGMLIFTDRLAILNPFPFFHADGVLMAVAMTAIIVLWKSRREEKTLNLLFALTAGFYILVFNPVWVPFIMEKITYLIIRFSVAVPAMLLSAFLIHALWMKMRGKSDHPSNGTAIAGSIIIAVLLIPALLLNITDFSYWGSSRHSYEKISANNLGDLFKVLNERIPEGSVVASDPLTSYCLLAFTDHYVVCTYDQHSTPNDSTALRRIKDVRDIYLPFTSCDDITCTMDEYDAEYIVFNGRIPTSVRSDYWMPDRENASIAAAKLSKCEESFELIYSGDSVHLFRYTRRSEDDPEEISVGTKETHLLIKGEYSGDYTELIPSGLEGVYLKSWNKYQDKVTRGEMIRLTVDWVAEATKEFGSYVMYIRFDTDYEKGPLYNPGYGKIYRKFIEKIRGKRYRFRVDKLPFEGIYPPDMWTPGKIFSESFEVPVPKDIAPGTYTISIRLHEAPHLSNIRIKDLLNDDDFYDGPDLMTITIE